MALWDALSGKILHFNNTKEQANRRVCMVLKNFVSSRLPKYPQSERMFIEARNVLYAFYLGGTGFLSHNIDGCLTRYKPAIYSLNVHNYLCLMSALHAGHVVGTYLVDSDSPGAKSWFFLLIEGICEIYRRPDSYMMDWINRLEWIAGSEGMGTRLSFAVYDEIAPILGLPQIDTTECIAWAQVRQECARCMGGLYDQPDWNEAVEAELAAHR